MRSLRERSLRLLEQVQGLIISDYDKGTLSPDLLAALLPDAARRGMPIVVDPKVRLFKYYGAATVVTPNSREAMEAAGMVARTDQEFEEMARRLLKLLGGSSLLITRGERGMLLQEKAGPPILIQISKSFRVDPRQSCLRGTARSQ